MKNVTVTVKKVNVVQYMPADNAVTFSMAFSDSSEKEVTKAIPVKLPDVAAIDLIREVRKMAKRMNAGGTAESVLDSHIHIIIDNEDKITEKLTEFVRDVFDRVDKLKGHNMADGYLGKITEINSMKKEF